MRPAVWRLSRATDPVAHAGRRPATGQDLTTTGRPTARHTDATRAHERLTRIQGELRRVRATERVLAEQVAHLDAVAADAKTRKLVAQTPLADRDWRAARTDRDRHRVLLEEARRGRRAACRAGPSAR